MGGTVDLNWTALSSSLSDSVLTLLNAHLSTTPRPSFIGPITINSFEFGSLPPDVEIIDVRDIHRDFRESDGSDNGDDVEAGSGSGKSHLGGGFEWVPRRETSRPGPEQSPAYHTLAPHLRYTPAASSMPGDFIPPTFPGIHRDLASSVPDMPKSIRNLQPGSSRSTPSLFRPATTPFADAFSIRSHTSPLHNLESTPETSNDMDVQLHFHISYTSNLRLTLSTSLQINYPSPMFMALPVKLAVTGLVFEGEVVVAYEASRQRVHFCIPDDLDPYSLTAQQPHPSELDTKPLPIGTRLLPSIFIESEIGQADKHVLRNVSRVERFIQDVIRKTIEEELVFPNFHTLIL
jgi:distribution and morphology protein 12